MNTTTPEGESRPTQDPERIGPYSILGVLGEGGMGTVYLAEQKEPVRRRVALKVIKLGMDSRQVLNRFEAERQALAMMEHSSIARVLDAGSTANGRPYFAMEYVKGIPLCKYCDDHKLGIRARLQLFKQVCSGVQHAHQKGVIHRDLKPGNVLISDQDGKPTAKIIDFGLARATDHRLVEATIFTQQGQTIGTPEYMSPEQAGLSGLDIDTRTDVYSLGVILYELLTGELPFSSAVLRSAGLFEVERLIREDAPPRPSTRLSGLGVEKEQVAALRHTDAKSLLRRLSGDLDWVVMKALEKDRSRRYQTAIELAQEIERYLADAPVLATPPNLRYRAGKFCRRYRGQVIGATVVLVTILVGFASTTFFWIKAQANLERFNLVAIGDRLLQAQQKEASLYPAWPENAQRMEDWINQEAGPLKNHETTLKNGLEELTAQTTRATDTQFLIEALQAQQEEMNTFLDPAIARVNHALVWAKAVREVSITAHVDNWEKARLAIAKADGVTASKLYSAAPIDLRPQMGLVPIGMNPVTKLWEFYHLRSAWDPKSGMHPAKIPIPEHNEDGSIPVTEGLGIVFVLIPGGWLEPLEFEIEDGAGSPPESGELEAYFLARHELTQGQWSRLTERRNPSHQAVGETNYGRVATPLFPVEMLSLADSEQLLKEQGLIVPTQAQWEYTCRAGTATEWSTGDLASSLLGFANVLDKSALSVEASWGTGESFDDGFIGSAPVGSFLPNNFGLYDMHGNVEELCRIPSVPGMTYLRGGSFMYPAYRARSVYRFFFKTPNFNMMTGVRPARVIQN